MLAGNRLQPGKVTQVKIERQVIKNVKGTPHWGCRTMKPHLLVEEPEMASPQYFRIPNITFLFHPFEIHQIVFDVTASAAAVTCTSTCLV